MDKTRTAEHCPGELVKLPISGNRSFNGTEHISGLTTSEYMQRCWLNERLHSQIMNATSAGPHETSHQAG